MCNSMLSATPNRACYIAIPIYICGFLVLGASFQNHLSPGAIVMGWGLAETAVMINTVAVCKCIL
jgi:hypothetical protein